MAILITVIAFGIMVVLHELGHFVAAKSFGVQVHEFAVGMGPKLFSFGKGETKYSLRLFPIGGYVKLEGENELEENDNPRSFSNLTPFKRIIVLVSGALMNLLLGLLIFTFINVKMGITPSVIKDIDLNSSYVTSESQLLKGDEIVKLDNTTIHTYEDVALFMSRTDGDEIDVVVKRGNEKLKLPIKPYKTDSGYKLGIMFKSEKCNLFEAVEYAIYDTVHITKSVLFAVGDLITGKVGLNALSGPVEIVSVVDGVTSQKGDYVYLTVLMLFAMITVNLGVFNLLPLPALDGGSIIFALYELVTRKKVNPKIVGYISAGGFILLMLLAVYVTIGDILSLI